MERNTLANHSEVHSRKEETTSEDKQPAGLRKYASSYIPASSLAASLSAAPPSSQTPPSSGNSSVFNFEAPCPFWEPDYPSQRFCPVEYEAEDPGDVCYSPPSQLFSPPVSPNEIEVQHTSREKGLPAGPSVCLKGLTSSSTDPTDGMKSTAFTPVYKGFTFTPRSNLTAYGTFADRSKLQDASLGGVYTLMNSTEGTSHEADSQPSVTGAMARKVSKETQSEESLFSSEAEIHPCAGVPVGVFEGDIPTMNEHQEKSFEELETERGIMEWNNSVFDERWLDPSTPNLQTPNNPRRPTTPGMITGQQIQHASAKHQRWISFLQDLESTRKKMDLSARFRPNPSIWGKGDKSPPPEKVLHEEQPTKELAPEPPWPGRLQEVVRDLEGGTGELPHGITHRPAVLRRYFYDRVFQQEWQWSGTDEQRMTKSGGCIRSVGTVRDHVLKDVEDLISFMTAPVGHGIRKVTFPRTPEAAALRKEDPFGGNSADPREEHFMRRFRRIGGYADLTSLRGYEGRNAMTEAMGNQPGSGADAGLDISLKAQSSTSLALGHYPLDQKLASTETHDISQAEGHLVQKHTSEPNGAQSSDSKSFSDLQGQKSSSSGNHAFSKQLSEIEPLGASGSEGRPLSEDAPVGHNKAEITPATNDNSSLKQHQPSLLRAASEHPSSSQENRSSSQATLTAESNDNMEPIPFHLMDDQDVGPDAKFANYTQHRGFSPSLYAAQASTQDHRLPADLVHARMFKRSDWENYVPPSSVVDRTQMQLPSAMLSGPPPSVMHPGYGHQQISHADFGQSASDAPQQAIRPTFWEEAYAQQPTRVLQRPSRSIARQSAYAGTDQTAHNNPLQTPYAAPQSMQYGAQPMRHGYPQQAVGYAGSSTTDTGSRTAYEAPTSRATYVTQGMMSQPMHLRKTHSYQPQSYNNVGVRAPAPNRFAAILARSKEFENYCIPQARVTPTSSQAFRQHQIQGTPDPSQAYAQNQVHGFPLLSEAYNQTRYGGAPILSQAPVQNQVRGTPIPFQAFIQNRVRGSLAPNEAYIYDQFGQAPAASQAMPQYPIRGTSEQFQSFPDSHIRLTRTPTQAVQNSYEWQSRFGIPPDMVKPDLPILHYRDGSDDMRPHCTEGVPTVAYQNLVRNSEFNYEVLRAAEHLPFTETARDTKPVEWGVLKIGNIPYDISKDLVASFLGNHAKLITANLGPAIHIIMDRVSGKTMDCFVEFLSPLDARATCNSINLRQRGLIRISDRVVDVNMSSQNELLATLFPKAKDVKWVNGRPIIMQPEEEWSSGFKGFVSAEELGLLVKHAEQPHRSNYTQRSPQRCYESMISLLTKFPWHSVENYTLHQRNLIFNAARQMLHILSINIRKQYRRDNHSRAGSSISYTTAVSHGSSDRYIGIDRYGGCADSANSVDMSINPGSRSAEALTEDLLKDLLSAGLNAAGFSENQRWQLYEACEYAKHHFIVSPVLQHWPFRALGRKVKIEEDVLKYYAQIIANNPEVEQTGFSFGNLRTLVAGLEIESQTMDEVSRMELIILEGLLMSGVDNALMQRHAERDMAALTL